MLDNIPEVFIETTVNDFQWFPDWGDGNNM